MGGGAGAYKGEEPEETPSGCPGRAGRAHFGQAFQKALNWEGKRREGESS